MFASSRQLSLIVLSWACLLISVCVMPRVSHSATRTLHAQPLVIHGAQGSHETLIELHEPESVELTLQGTLSELVDATSSSLAIWVDDRPLRTTSFTRIMTQGSAQVSWRLSVRLPRLEPGFHRVSVRSALQREDDPCFQKDPEGAWVRIDTMRATARDEAWHPSEALANFPALWNHQAPPGTTRPTVVIHASPLREPAALSAYLAADALLRDMGFEIELVTGQLPIDPSTTYQGHLWLDVNATQPLDTPTMLEARADTVYVRGRTWQDVRHGVRALGQPRVLRHCQDTGCTIPGALLHADMDADEDSERARVQRLGGLGFNQGWVARGSGTHTLQTTWQRPAHWEVLARPTYTMILHTAMTSRWIDVQQSVLRISLNGTPLDQYTLESESKQGAQRLMLSADVPEAFWKAESWTFVIEAVLKPAHRVIVDAAQCMRDSDDIWVRLDPESGLWVPRKERRDAGLSVFGEEERPVVAWRDGLDSNQVIALGAMVYPLSRTHGPLDVHNAPDCTAQPCVMIRQFGFGEDTMMPQPFALTAAGLIDESGLYGIPAVPAMRTLILDMSAHRMTVWMPERSERTDPVNPPDYTQLRGHQALYVDGTWYGAPAPAKPEDTTRISKPWLDAQDGDARDGAQERLLSLIDKLWWIMLALSCGGAAIYFRRRTRATPMDTFDASGYEALEQHDPKK